MFLIKAVTQLKEGGRASFIVPTQFLNSDYGIAIKEFLLKEDVLKYVIVLEDLVFDDAITTSTILLIEKGNHENFLKEYLRFKVVNDFDDLHIKRNMKYYKFSMVYANEK